MRRPDSTVRFLFVTTTTLSFGFGGAAAALAQLRVATWNVTNYESGREADFKTALYAEFEGRRFAPDVLIGQEFLSKKGQENFLRLLNEADDSPGDWAAAPFVDGPDTDSALFYRTSRISFLAATIVSKGGEAPQHPRHLMRYNLQLKGYTAPATILACYSSHMKSGSTEEDRDRRNLEAERLRQDAAGLHPEWQFVVGADLNIPTAAEAAYQTLVGADDGDDGRVFDPIATPAKWNNNSEYRFIHTQDPSGAGGMDDRFDQLLVSAGLIDGSGFDYIGDPTRPFSDSTWNDPYHSQRVWGNDGTSFNQRLTIAGNTMVGESIAQALVNVAGRGGHLPVYLELRVPPAVDAPSTLDFGRVTRGSEAIRELVVANAGDVELWSQTGIADLHYVLQAPAEFTAPAGDFVDPPGDAGNSHRILMDTQTLGVREGALRIWSDAPDDPERLVWLRGEVIPDRGDLNCDGQVNFDDIDPFVLALIDPAEYGEQFPDCDPRQADVDENGVVDFNDIDPFVALVIR